MTRTASNALIVGFVFLLAGPRLFAQDMGARRDLLTQAQNESNAGHHDRAIDLGLRAGALLWTPSLRAFLAYEYQQTHQITEGISMASECVHDVSMNPNIQDGSRIRGLCERVLVSLNPLAGHLTVRPGSHSDGFQVTVAGRVLNPAFYGAPYLVSPGHVEIVASAAGHETFRQFIDIAQGATVEVIVPALAATRSEQASNTNDSPTNNPSPSPAPARSGHPEQTPHSGPSLALPAVVIAVGAVGMIAGGIFWGVLRSSALTTASGYCSSGSDGAYHCQNSSAAMSAAGNVVLWNDAADVAFAVGGVVLAVGAAWLIGSVLGGHGTHDHANAEYLVPLFASGAAGVALGGSF